MTNRVFGVLPDGQTVRRLEISGYGMRAWVLTLGASLQNLRLDGIDHPLVLGYPELAPYLTHGRYFGAVVGRCANRIAGGTCQINGQTLTLDRNENNRTTLHGGSDGTGQRNWLISESGPAHLALSHLLPEGHMGFPGSLLLRVTYRILPGPVLSITMLATSTETTLCNLAQHSYFNLDGQDTVADHWLTSPAPRYLPVDADLIPLGPRADVQDTPLDFRQPVQLGPRLSGPVIDHNLCVYPDKRLNPRRVASLSAGSVKLDIDSTEPGLQVYLGDHLRGEGPPGNHGKPYGQHAGIALESQLWPDAVHHPDYPTTLLTVGRLYRQVTNLAFSRMTSS